MHSYVACMCAHTSECVYVLGVCVQVCESELLLPQPSTLPRQRRVLGSQRRRAGRSQHLAWCPGPGVCHRADGWGGHQGWRVMPGLWLANPDPPPHPQKKSDVSNLESGESNTHSDTHSPTHTHNLGKQVSVTIDPHTSKHTRVDTHTPTWAHIPPDVASYRR